MGWVVSGGENLSSIQDSKNEATFEAHLSAVLGTLFPGNGVTITHQVQFTVRLGRADISVDGTTGWKKGRLDVLISSAVGPVAVLELKREDLTLTDEDRDQGLSYARLLQPMPPLVIVSNGRVTNFYTTVDGKAWVPESLSEEVFEKLVAGAAARAAQQRDEAIRHLLASGPHLWTELLRSFTRQAIEDRTGDLDDVTFQFGREFLIERSVCSGILGRLEERVGLVALVGPPLSGKSTVLMQCCRMMESGPLVPLYVDASDAHQGPFRLLASLFERHIFAASNTDQVRQWLTTSLRSMGGDARLVLVIDDVMPELTSQWMSDLDELIALTRHSPVSILIALDPNPLQALSCRPARSTKTEFGRSAEVFSLDPLSDEEFLVAMEVLFAATRSTPYFGAQYNAEYREPRVLRVLAASSVRQGVADDDTMLKFPSTTTVAVVELVWRAIARKNLDMLDDLRAFARAYIDDRTSQEDGPEVVLSSFSAPALRRDAAARLMPVGAMDRLMGGGFVSTRLGPGEEVVIFPRHLELFARAAALEIAAIVTRATDLSVAYDKIISLSEMVPLGDIVGALALQDVARRNPDRVSKIVNQALHDVPRVDILPAGTVLDVSLFGRPPRTIELPDSVETTGNLQPWLVLAQLAMLDLEGPSGTASPNGWIMATVGNFPGLLRRVSDTGRIEGFHFHEVEGRGSVPCRDHGVVEPIGQAMIAGFHERPAEMISMAEYAISQDQFHLVWRLNSAAQDAMSATAEATGTAAETVLKLTEEYLRRDFEGALHEETQAAERRSAPPQERGAACAAKATMSEDERRRRRNKKKRLFRQRSGGR